MLTQNFCFTASFSFPQKVSGRYFFGPHCVWCEREKIAIENNSDSIDRLRCFVGDTYSDDIYCLDGYGNLKNINDGDFETLCEDLARIVEQQLDEQEEM